MSNSVNNAASNELQQALKEQQEIEAKIEALRKQTREADLKTVIELIKLHGFTPTNLRSAFSTAKKRTTRSTTRKRK
jgi:DNA-binding protein H-NS